MRGLLFLIACLASGQGGAEIYRWVDSSGQVHFGERPMADDAQRIELPADNRGPGPAVPSDAARRARQQRMLEAFEYDRERKTQQEAEAAQRARRLAAECERARRYWRQLNFPGPIYKTDDNGQRRYLDDAERAAEKDRLRPMYRKVCGEPAE